MKPGDIIRYKNQCAFLQSLGEFKVRSVKNGRIFFTDVKGRLLSSSIEFTQKMFQVVGESELLSYDESEGF